MKTIQVRLEGRSYPVMIGDGLIDRAGELLAPWAGRGHIVIVADERLLDSHCVRLQAALAGSEWVRSQITIPVAAGDDNKGWPQLQVLVEALLDQDVERGDHIIALGGGVIGDLAGFAAAILKRGCGYIQVPTTLLAQVDSSVGGKTAINVAKGKNLVGAFHQPSATLIDPSTLETLPERQLRAGYAEAVKCGLIGDADFFSWCEAHGASVIAGDREARLHAIATSVRFKAGIVQEDDRETNGRRALLNLGHTFGHALEAETGFSDRLLHGEAVALGLALAFRFSVGRGLCSAQDAERVAGHLSGLGLPIRLQDVAVTIRTDGLIGHMRNDKKRSGGELPFILTRGIGQTFLAQDVAIGEVEAFLERELSA